MQIPHQFVMNVIRKDSSLLIVHNSEISKYALVGLVGTSVHYMVMATLISIFSVGLILSSTSGAIAGALVNYLLNYFYTFQSHKRHQYAVMIFWLVAAFGWSINAILLMFSENVLNINIIPAQITTTFIVFLLTCFMNRLWTFN